MNLAATFSRRERGRLPDGSGLDVRADKIGRPAVASGPVEGAPAFRWQASDGPSRRGGRIATRWPLKRGQNIYRKRAEPPAICWMQKSV
jgi:hypothetical protein